jgi:hypothetical protein
LKTKRFNRRYREEALDCYAFETSWQMRRMTADWITPSNKTRLHESLGNVALRQYLTAQCPKPATAEWSETTKGLE